MPTKTLLAVLTIALTLTAARAEDALRDYVAAPDESYAYTVRQRADLAGVAMTELTLTSQTWRGIAWKHQLFIVKPAHVTAPKHALLLIDGGNWRDRFGQPPAEGRPDIPGEARLFAMLAERFGSPVAVVRQVPFQPIFDNLREDAAIAYTFDRYLADGDARWPLLLPMTKAAVRAMDAVQAFVKDEWNYDVEHFTVTGASKRGWTTWLTGSVDPRVSAIAPMVIDVLNMGPQMHHQLDSWGAFSPMIHDYEQLNIIARLGEPAGQKLVSIVDPYAHRAHLTMPKLVILGTNDPYWPVDALNLYWDGLPGEKRILYVPNAGHSLETGLLNVAAGIVATHRAATGALTLPKLDWTFDERDDAMTIDVTADRAPMLVQAWSAQSTTRDFRGSSWVARPLVAEDGRYTFTLKRPAEGHAAAFVDLVFQDGDLTYNLTTQLRVIPAMPAEKAAKAE